MTTAYMYYRAQRRIRLGPDDDAAAYGVGVWHEDTGSGPLCNQRCTDYHDRNGNLKPGTWEYNGPGMVECGNCARITRTS